MGTIRFMNTLVLTIRYETDLTDLRYLKDVYEDILACCVYEDMVAMLWFFQL